MNSMLQGLLPFLKSNPNRLINIALINEVLSKLYKVIHFNPNTKLAEHDELLDKLCELSIELATLKSPKLSDQTLENIKAVEISLKEVLEGNKLCGECLELQKQLQNLAEDLAQYQNSKPINFKMLVTLFITFSPLFGYFLYQSFVDINNGAILEDVDFIYPEQNTVEKTAGIYGFKEQLLQDYLVEFRQFYFAETLGLDSLRNPLPNLFTGMLPSDLNDRFLPSSNLIISLAQKKVYSDVYAAGDHSNNINIFRVFIRNLQSNHLLKRIRVSAELINEDTFPWKELDVSATTNVQMDIQKNSVTNELTGDNLLDFTFTAQHSPITDLQVQYTLATNDIDYQSSSKFYSKHVTTQSVDSPVFDKSVLHLWSKNWLMMQIETQYLTELGLSSSDVVSAEQLKNELQASPNPDNFFQSISHRVVTCADNKSVLLSSFEKIQSTGRVEIVTSIKAQQQFLQLDGKQLSTNVVFNRPNQLMITDLPATTHYSSLLNCVGPEIMGLTEHYAPSEVMQSIVHNTATEVFANFLMGEPLNPPTEIAVERTLFFDFEDDPAIIATSTDDVVSIDKNQFAQLNLVTTHFRGGIYRFRFYFDEVEIDSVDVNLLWPQSLHYKPGDEVYFRVHGTYE